jgi:hypothetical protein
VASLSSDLNSVARQLKLDQVLISTYPTTLALANNGIGITPGAGTTYRYIANNSTSPVSFCVDATKNGQTYKITGDSLVSLGDCDNFGLLMHLDAGNVASYPGAGVAWNDLSGSGNDSTLIGGMNYVVTNGGAMNLDGIDDYAEVATGRNVLSTDSTIALNIYSTSWVHQTYIALIGSRQVGNDGVMFFTDTTGALSCDWGSNRWVTGYTIPLNQWVKIAVTRDANGRKLYINGALQNSTVAAGGPTSANTTLRVGSVSVGGPYYFKGMIDDVRAYNRVLSIGEISAL